MAEKAKLRAERLMLSAALRAVVRAWENYDSSDPDAACTWENDMDRAIGAAKIALDMPLDGTSGTGRPP